MKFFCFIFEIAQIQFRYLILISTIMLIARFLNRNIANSIIRSLPVAKPAACFCSSTFSITSAQAKQKFQNLLENCNDDQSLIEAAEMMAELQVKVETLEKQISVMQTQLQQCPSNTIALIQKIQKVMDNIQWQNQEIIGIEKRAEKELNDCKNYSVGGTAKQILQIADSIQRCYNHARQINKDNSHEEQVKMFTEVLTEIHSIFEIYGIKQFDPLGETFDPNMQQAVANVPLTEGKKPNTVAFTSRTGYTIKGRLLRSAHVGVFQL